jgi:dipeptidyl aminopeptidase/acylaminoacyl peptidase
MRLITTTLGLLFTSLFALSLAGCGSGGTTGGGGGGGGAAGNEPTEITFDNGLVPSKPRFSPDGKTVAFIQSADTFGKMSDLWVMDPTGGARKKLAPTNTYLAAPTWTPDGKQIYFASDPGVSLVDAAGGTATLIVDDFTATDPEVSPDGKSLVYAPNGGTLQLIDLADPTMPKDLGVGGVSPRFSPDGKSIAFAGASKIELLDIASGAVTDLADGTDLFSSVAWFADGKELVFTSDKGVETVTLGATPVRKLVHEEFAATTVDLSHDGKTIIYSTNASQSLYVLTGF